MRLFIFILLVTSSQYGYAQESSHQSFKHFNGFIIGNSVDAYAGDLQLDLEISYGTKYYKYAGKLLRKYKELKVHDINLGFHEDKLIYLDLYFKHLDDNAFDYLLEQLTLDYGESVPFTALDKGVISSFEWKEKDLTMQLYRYNDEASDHADRQMTVLAISEN